MSNNIFLNPNPKIYHFIPWDSSKNIGLSYNNFMELLSDDDWGCFLDGDAIHTTTFFGKRIEDIIHNNPDFNLLTCYTNRVACAYQIPNNVSWVSNDMLYHRDIGEKLWNQNKINVQNITNENLLSGVLILIRKSEWSKVGGFSENGMLGVDNNIHLKFRSAGFKVGLMKGIYVQHWYRGGDKNNTKHLIR